MAPGVLDVPAVQSLHNVFAGLLPVVPARHAVKPDGLEASILDPSGTTTEEDPPVVTIDPASTESHSDCSGSGCKYPVGHSWHFDDFVLPFSVEYLPGEQSLHPSILGTPLADEYVPTGHALQDASEV